MEVNSSEAQTIAGTDHRSLDVVLSCLENLMVKLSTDFHHLKDQSRSSCCRLTMLAEGNHSEPFPLRYCNQPLCDYIPVSLTPELVEESASNHQPTSCAIRSCIHF